MDSNTWTFFVMVVVVFGGMGYLEYRAGYRPGKQAARHFLVMFACAAGSYVAADLLHAYVGWYGPLVMFAVVIAVWAVWRRRRKRAAEPAQEASRDSAPRSQA